MKRPHRPGGKTPDHGPTDGTGPVRRVSACLWLTVRPRARKHLSGRTRGRKGRTTKRWSVRTGKSGAASAAACWERERQLGLRSSAGAERIIIFKPLLRGPRAPTPKNRSQTMSQNTTLPPLADNAPGVNGFKYKPRFGVIVICKDEEEHKRVYERLCGEGYKCRVVRV